MRTFYGVAQPFLERDMARFNRRLLYAIPWPGQNICSKAGSIQPDTAKSMKVRTLDRSGSGFFR